MPRCLAVLVLLLATLLGGAFAARASEGPPKLPKPKLQDIRVWYYPPGARTKPVTLLWWKPERIMVQRRIQMKRKGMLRVRVLVSGGFEEEPQGPLNYVSLHFRDDTTTLFDTPHELRPTHNGIKDLTWRIPYTFAAGPMEIEVVAWSARTPYTTLGVGAADRTNAIVLGHVVD